VFQAIAVAQPQLDQLKSLARFIATAMNLAMVAAAGIRQVAP
jgi:hypothetical protein